MRPPFSRHEAPQQRNSGPSRDRDPAYLIVDEATLDSTLDSMPDGFPSSYRPRAKDTPGVCRPASVQASSSTISALKGEDARTSHAANDDDTLLLDQTELSRPATASIPLSPVLGGSCSLSSAVSLSSSPRNLSAFSIGNFAESHAEASSRLSPRRQRPGTETSSQASTGSRAPHLMMPSIMMPRRRPFTDVGKSIGKLTIMMVGGSGIGKTSLIKAIVQACEHIVHADPIDNHHAAYGSENESDANVTTLALRHNGGRTKEINASTKPYPTWWTEWDRSAQPSCPVNAGTPVLERNIRFIDTMGYRNDRSPPGATVSISQYVEAQLARNSVDSLDNAGLLKMLARGGGSIVDVSFFLISETGLQPADVELMKRLTPLTNIIPMIAKADNISEKQMQVAKREIAQSLAKEGIRQFRFSGEDTSRDEDCVYTVSSVTESDRDTLDASVLMSSEYIEPLVPTDLALLLQRVFCEDGSAQLRHAAARKCVRWADEHRRKAQPMALVQQQPLSANRVHFMQPWMLGDEDFARPVMHLDLRDWATNLRQSLEKAGPQDRMITWPVVARTSTRAGTAPMVVARRDGELARANRKGRGAADKRQPLSPQQDPLGLLHMAGEARRTGVVALEVIGGVGMMGIFSWLAGQG